jgi:hydrogenase-4 component F
MILFALLIVSLAAGPLAFYLRKRRDMEAVNVAANVVLLILSAALAAQVLRCGPVSVLNGFFYADALSALVVLLSTFAALACSVYAVGYFRHEERSGALQEAEETGGQFRIGKLREYYTLMPLLTFATILVVLANNLGILWVAVEGTTLASVFLVMFYGRETSLEAAWKYAILGGVGLSLALFGTILVYYSAYGALGTESLAGLNWSVLAVQAVHFDKPTMRLAFILILLGYGTKAGIAPMHTWKPDAYSEAPIPGAAMLATGVLNCALYGLVRFYILSAKCLGPGFGSRLLILFGLLSIAVAVPFILVQKNFRRLLAYSSIDHSGIMVLALGFGGPLGMLGMLLHMTFHSITKPLLFFCAGNVQQQLKTDLFSPIKGGVIHAMPLTGAAFLLVTLAVTGSPPFSFFQSEFTILRAGFAAGHLALAALFIAFLATIFCGFLVHIANLVLGEDPGLPRTELCPWKRGSIVGLVVVIVVMGFWIPAPLFHLIQHATEIVMGAQ